MEFQQQLKTEDSASAPDRLDYLLESVFGFEEWRPGQREAVDAMASGRDVVAILPTGTGKSLCYQMAALTARGAVVVVSPIIALMVDQVRAARAVGISAFSIRHGMSEPEYIACRDALRAGTCQLLFVSPERFVMGGFQTRLHQMRVGAVVVDEAHLVAQWGQSFRPEYYQIGESIRGLVCPRAAFTASATAGDIETVVDKLGMKGPVIVRGGFDRPNLRYRVEQKLNDWPAQLVNGVAEASKSGRGIIYSSYRTGVDKTVEILRGAGIKAMGYHAGLGTAPRNMVQQMFQKGHCNCLVATVAFGMGIDIPDIRWVFHADVPRTIENYYQETGRAGRDGEPAECCLFWNHADVVKARWFSEQTPEGGSSDAQLDAVLKLRKMTDYIYRGSICRRKQLLTYFGERYVGRCGNCDVCNRVDENKKRRGRG